MTLQEHVREVQLGLRVATQALRPPPERVGWLVGSGRSGTTWLASLLNADATMREMFEPVHRLHVPLMKGGADHPYFRPGELPAEWRTWQSEVFSGRHITKRTDRDNVGRNPAGARKLLVKDVFACGLIAANVAAHPDVAPALVMRHPIAVALSKQAHSDWLWTWSPEAFFTQSLWVEDHLGPHVDALTRVAREEGVLPQLVAVWAVLQHVALRSASPAVMPILHYESSVLDPWASVQELSAHPSWKGMVTANEQQVQAAAHRVSFVSKSAKASALPNPARWMNKVSSEDRAACERVLDDMGMADWHNGDGLPVPDAIQAWREAHFPPLA